MAGEEADAEDRTEAATPQRVEKARRDGDVPLSRETVQAASLGGAALALGMLGPEAGRELLRATSALLQGSHDADLAATATSLLEAVAPLTLGVAGLAALGGAAATLLQTRFLVSGKGLAPKLSKLNPRTGLKRMVGMQPLEELLRTLLKLATVGLALWWQAGDITAFGAALALGADDLASSIAARLGALFATALAALAAIAGIDLLWVRLRHARKLRMSREDIKEETKEAEGDPHFKARRMQLMRSRSRRRALAATAKATVLVTNPTHYAVALAYERGKDAAPRVTARGVDELAARMREVAAREGVPIVPNPPLARALYRLPEDAQIPPEHFKAVAEIIALVWRLGQRRT